MISEEKKEVVVRRGQFQKGISGNPSGAPKRPQKKTLILNNFLEAVVDDNTKRFKKELKKLSGKAYVDAILTMMEYVKPKLARTEVSNPDGSMKPVQVFVINGKEIEL